MQAQRQPVAPSETLPEFIPVRQTRALLGRPGSPVALQTVYSLGVRREIDVRLIGSRFFVTRDSVESYRVRNGL